LRKFKNLFFANVRDVEIGLPIHRDSKWLSESHRNGRLGTSIWRYHNNLARLLLSHVNRPRRIYGNTRRISQICRDRYEAIGGSAPNRKLNHAIVA
jgi:hypothetical protein